MFKKEFHAIIEIIKSWENKKNNLDIILEDDSLNWIEILGYLCYHRIAGFAYEILKNTNLRKLDFPVFLTLSMINQKQKELLNFHKRYIKQISVALNQAGISHVFLKGSVLSFLIYPPGSRVSYDIDILIHKKSIHTIREVLYKLGFLEGKYNYEKNIIEKFDKKAITLFLNTRGELAPFVKVVNLKNHKIINVDVNFSLGWKRKGIDKLINLFLRQKIAIPIENRFFVYSLKKEHLFIHLCSHFYKEAVLIDIIKKRKVLDLYKFVDIYIFIKKYFEKINISEIFNISKKYSLDKCIFFTMYYISKLFPDVLEIKNFKMLLNKYNYIKNKKIMKFVFDQDDTRFYMIDKGDLLERVFSYNIIKRYGPQKPKKKSLNGNHHEKQYLQ